MQQLHKSIYASVLTLAMSASAHAATEDLSAANDNAASAQDLGSLTFAGLNIFGVRGRFGPLNDDNHADFYAFRVTGPGDIPITLSVDTPFGPQGSSNPLVALFGSVGKIAEDDDSGPGVDARLSFTVSSSGLYYAAVTGSGDANFDGLDDATGLPANTDYTYSLKIRASGLDEGGGNSVPLPGAIWLLGSAILGVLGISRRRG